MANENRDKSESELLIIRYAVQEGVPIPRYYIQAEAFNLDHMVYDTHDISTIRGGSFLLLDAVKRLPEAFEGKLEPIATAASKGVFAYEDPGSLDAQRAGMVLEVLRVLHDATGGHATFLVAVEEDVPDDFQLVLNRLEAEVRRQQWRMPTVVVPPFTPTDQECYLDGWRPGVKPYTLDPEMAGVKISMAADFRRKEGRKIKQSLFSRLLNDPTYGDDLVAKDLGKLATDPNKGILNGKIALIQVDGNSFGRIRKGICDTDTKRSGFDKAIQDNCRNEFLRDLLIQARADPDFQVVGDGKTALRIELLLWGGDEFTLVVPAWKGLEVIERFFHFAEKLQFEGVPMTHRAAVIFCHYDSPILQIRQLADKLLAMTKTNIKRKFEEAFTSDPTLASLSQEDRNQQLEWLSNAKYGNAAGYLVLESFDMLRGSLEQFLKSYYGIADTSNMMLLYGSEMSKLRDNLHTICSSVPKGRVVNIAHSISQGDAADANKLQGCLSESVAPNQRDAACTAIKIITDGNKSGWFLLADLWDYAEEWKA